MMLVLVTPDQVDSAQPVISVPFKAVRHIDLPAKAIVKNPFPQSERLLQQASVPVILMGLDKKEHEPISDHLSDTNCT